jgi:cell wall-associated NlpC family hydrolase
VRALGPDQGVITSRLSTPFGAPLALAGLVFTGILIAAACPDQGHADGSTTSRAVAAELTGSAATPGPVSPAAAVNTALDDQRDILAAKRDSAAAREATRIAALVARQQAALAARQQAALAAAADQVRATQVHTTSRSSRGSSRSSSGGKPRSSSRQWTPVPDADGSRAGAVVQFVYAQLGKPYVRAADGPGGFDCSGLVKAAYAKAGVSLPHKAWRIGARGRSVPFGQAQPGDVLAYKGHVAVYVGGGKMIEAPHKGASVRLVAARKGSVRRLL